MAAPGDADWALLAWVQASLPSGSLPVDSLEDLADGEALLLVARRFLPEAAAAAAGRRLGELEEVAEILRAERPRQAGALLPEARALLPWLLVVSVEGSEKQQAVGCIMRLDSRHQAPLAALIRRQMAAGGGGGGSAPSGGGPGVPSASSRPSLRRSNQHTLIPRPSLRRSNERNWRRGSLNEEAEAEDEEDDDDEDMVFEVQELQTELEDKQRQCDAMQGLHQHEAAALRTLKKRLCDEADSCHELDRELDHRSGESRLLGHNVKLMREELRHVRGSAELDGHRSLTIQRRLEEERNECRTLQRRHSELENQLEHAEKTNERRLSWKRTALRTKLTRLTEVGQNYTRHLRHARSVESTEHACEVALQGELRDAQARLAERDTELSDVVARFRGTEESLYRSQSRLEACQREVRVLRRAGSTLHVEGQARRSTRRLDEREEQSSLVWQLGQADHEAAHLGELAAALAESEAEVQSLRPRLGALRSRAEAEEAGAEGRLLEARRALEAAREEADDMERRAATGRQATEACRARSLEAEAEAAEPRRPPPPAEEASQEPPTEEGAEVLEEHLALRERELCHRFSLPGEAEFLRDREVRLMASALHRLGLRYGRLLRQCEALEAEHGRAEASRR